MLSLKIKLIICSLAALGILFFLVPEKTLAQTYVNTGYVYSTSLIPVSTTTTSNIISLTYNATAIPAGTNLRLQITTDDISASAQNWYNSDGVLNAWEELSVGTHSLDLQPLGWKKNKFYYRLLLSSDGYETPVLDYITLDYSTGTSTYPLGGSFTSNNMLFTNSIAKINAFNYNALDIPAGGSMKVQFSYDQLSWYDSAGVLNGRNTMSEGANTIDLSSLAWTKPAFYYRIWFTSDGTETPVLDAVSVSFEQQGGEVSSFSTYGMLTSKNLINDSNSWITSLAYTASSIPSGASLRLQITTDDMNADVQNWYNLNGVINEWETLSSGTHTFDLQSLGMNKRSFYYRIWFSSNGTNSPILDSVGVNYSNGTSTYPLGGSFTSNNLLFVNSVAKINGFNYNASVLPSGSSAKIQFSFDRSSWYDSVGVLNGRTDLSEGQNSIDLADLNWTKSAFYYRVWFTSNGEVTPVIDSVSLSFDLQGGDGSSYMTTGLVTSNNLVNNVYSFAPSKVNYITSAIPANTSLRMQFSTDGYNWYSSTSTFNGYDVLSLGANSIDLPSLSWMKSGFYYRVWFISNGSATPVLDYVSVQAATTENLVVGSYESSGTVVSNTLLPSNVFSNLNSFDYEVSSLPASTSVKLQFSKNGDLWYNSLGVLNASNTLALGTSTIDLSNFSSTTANRFYYKALLESNGSSTPILDSINLNYTLAPTSVPVIIVDRQGYQIATTTIPYSSQELGGAFTFVKDSGEAVVDTVVITQQGSLNPSYLGNLKLYYSPAIDNICPALKPNTAILFNNTPGSFSGNRATTTGMFNVTASTTCVYAIYDLSGAMSEDLMGQTVDLTISNPSLDVLAAGNTVTPDYSVTPLKSTILIYPNNSIENGGPITNVLSINVYEPSQNPTIYYLKNKVVYKKVGTKPAENITNPNLQVHQLKFTDMTPPQKSNGIIRIQTTISNMDPGNENTFLNVTRSYSTTVSVWTWRGDTGRQ